jgi:hypothetical protein
MKCFLFKSRGFLCVLLFLAGYSLAFGQSAYEGKGENRGSIAWAYYGRGNGIALIYDHGFSNLISAGGGIEFYHEDEDREFSYFGVFDVHLKELLGLPERLDLYPGVEVGSFDGEFELFGYLGVSFAFSEKLGIFTEIGNRGTLGLYYNF